MLIFVLIKYCEYFRHNVFEPNFMFQFHIEISALYCY